MHLDSLLSSLRGSAKKRNTQAVIERIAASKAEVEPRINDEGNPIKPQRAVKEINDWAPANSVFTTGVGNHRWWAGALVTKYRPGCFLQGSEFEPIGFGLPAAIGAKFALPHGSVIAVIGDGDFLFTGSELSTAVQHALKITVCVINDAAMGAERQVELAMYGKEIAVDLGNTDFAQIARGDGALGIRVERMEDIPSALAQAAQANGPVVIDFVVDRNEPYPEAAARAAIKKAQNHL